ncbi:MULTISPECIES: hypothetical protein [Streptomyces]|uniref:Uncharacterized protein n=1 Tax=Streptomyces yunnanensis TaxID=156453 RepID=A0A9X8N916_9ACTN|nr:MULTISPECIES: hypothetical protein [Streptomyces]SHN31382.1 hypothetical protein SAMN05216268_1349 [Streptomyces yunnanensis]
MCSPRGAYRPGAKASGDRGRLWEPRLHLELTGYDCFLGIETAGNKQVSGPQLKALFLAEAIGAGALVRGIFYPTSACT